jgi:hypothetical protein
MVASWSRSRDHAGYLQHVDRVPFGNSVPVRRSAAGHFPRFPISRRDFDRPGQAPFADGADDRDIRLPSAARIYLHGTFQTGRSVDPCRRTVVFARKCEASVRARLTPATAHLSNPPASDTRPAPRAIVALWSRQGEPGRRARWSRLHRN